MLLKGDGGSAPRVLASLGGAWGTYFGNRVTVVTAAVTAVTEPTE